MTGRYEKFENLLNKAQTKAEQVFQMFTAGDTDGKYIQIEPVTDDPDNGRFQGSEIDLSPFGWKAKLSRLELYSEEGLIKVVFYLDSEEGSESFDGMSRDELVVVSTKLSRVLDIATARLFDLKEQFYPCSGDEVVSETNREDVRIIRQIIDLLNSDESDSVDLGGDKFINAIKTTPEIGKDAEAIRAVFDAITDGRVTDVDDPRWVNLLFKIGTPAFEELTRRIDLHDNDRSWDSLMEALSLLMKIMEQNEARPSANLKNCAGSLAEQLKNVAKKVGHSEDREGDRGYYKDTALDYLNELIVWINNGCRIRLL